VLDADVHAVRRSPTLYAVAERVTPAGRLVVVAGTRYAVREALSAVQS
jgi:hypothetical protein